MDALISKSKLFWFYVIIHRYYLAYSETAISVTSTTLSYTDTIFSVPKGTYLIFLSANLVSVTANSDIIYLGLYNSSNNPLGIDMVSHNTRAGESDWRTSMGRVVCSTQWIQVASVGSQTHIRFAVFNVIVCGTAPDGCLF